MKILLDTSVVLRLMQPRTDACESVLTALDRLGQHGFACCLVPQIFYESRVVAARSAVQNGFGFPVEQACREMGQLTTLFTLLRDERSIYEQWQQLVRQYQFLGKNAHDARIVAAMIRHGISHLLTLNAKVFQRFAGITVCTPQTAPAELPNR